MILVKKGLLSLVVVGFVLLGWDAEIAHAQTVTAEITRVERLQAMCANASIPDAIEIDFTVSGIGTISRISLRVFQPFTGLDIAARSNTLSIPLDYAATYSMQRIVYVGFPDPNYGTIPEGSSMAVALDVVVGGITYSDTEIVACSDGVAGTVQSDMVVENTVAEPPDNRLNWQFGDTNVGILYPAGEDAVDLYIYDTDSYINRFVTADDIPDPLPTENTLLRSEGRISAYILPTGQIQFNFGPDVEGKTWVFIIDGWDDTEGEDSYYIPPPQ